MARALSPEDKDAFQRDGVVLIRGTSNSTRAAVSTRWLGDDVRWRPHPAADPSIRQEDLSVAPGELARDDDVFPVAWMRTTSGFDKHS